MSNNEETLTAEQYQVRYMKERFASVVADYEERMSVMATNAALAQSRVQELTATLEELQSDGSEPDVEQERS